MPITINYIADWQKRLRGRLYRRFRKPNWQALADLIARQAQDVEDAFQTLLTMWSIDDVDGATLERIGRFVGQPNLGWDTATYRSYIKTRILINRSAGTVPQLYAILKQAFGDIRWRIVDGGPKTFVVQAGETIRTFEAAAATLFLIAAKDAGARFILQWQTVPMDNVFRFDVGLGFDAGQLADATDRQR